MTGQLRISDSTGSPLVVTGNTTTPATLFTGNVAKSLGNNGQALRTFFSQPNWFRTVEPRREVFFYDDFMGMYTTPAHGLLSFADTLWSYVVNGAGATIGDEVVSNDNFGVVRLNGGTANNSRAVINKNPDSLSFGKGNFIAEFRVKFSVLGVPVSGQYIARIGYGDSTAALPTDNTDGVYFEYDNATSGNFWRCKTAVSGGAGSPTVSVTTAAIAADTWYTLRIEVNAAANSAKFYVDGTLVAENVANIPTGANTCGANAYICKSAGAANPALLIDYWTHSYVLTNLR